MKLVEFINKKYPWKMLDQKQIIKEFKENEKKKKKYFALKKAWEKLKAEYLGNEIIW